MTDINYVMACEQIEKLEAEIERLQAEVADRDKVCDSYAKENGQFHAEIERLKQENARQIAYSVELRGEREMLRAALQRIIDDKNLNHSSNWCDDIAREALGIHEQLARDTEK